ncbi:DUF421 domain-containing protein [Asticcacaulis taihuensis]|uniref:DUF421 domain-containing protein n=1 Tax=Asticcacaulis taihuensis TaxID=260084 RepID=UPI0026F29658|nr:YetF domain-containing protein [Asticcacaulis taihuensis]
MDHLFFDGWAPLLRVFVVGLASYVALIVMLRLSGKRTLSRMNAYDMVVTMALGSILTKAMLTKDQSIAESVLAIFLLIAFQYILSIAACRWTWFRKLVTASPTILYHDGLYLEAEMRRERVTLTEIEAAVHEKGVTDMREVSTVILGSNGQFSVLLTPQTSPPHSLGSSQSI